MKKILNKILGIFPMSRRQANKFAKEVTLVLEALQTSDAQHGNLEKNIIDQVGKLTTILEKSTPLTSPTKSGEKDHPEFG